MRNRELIEYDGYLWSPYQTFPATPWRNVRLYECYRANMYLIYYRGEVLAKFESAEEAMTSAEQYIAEQVGSEWLNLPANAYRCRLMRHWEFELEWFEVFIDGEFKQRFSVQSDARAWLGEQLEIDQLRKSIELDELVKAHGDEENWGLY